MRPTVLCAGEGMLELSGMPGAWSIGYGGDALNTAVHLARAGVKTKFFSALGTDPFSVHLRTLWEGQGLDCAWVGAHPDRTCGIYGVALDDAGERSFVYWRGESAAREMFALPISRAVTDEAASVDLLYFSLISLAILPPEGRDALLTLAKTVREGGGRVAFDANYRARLWSSPGEAADIRDQAIAEADIGLPSIDDEIALDGDATPSDVAERWQCLGCREVVVKLGSAGCRLPAGETIPPIEGQAVVDTSGAGDAFNAGYLAHRLAGHSLRDSAVAGTRVAGWVVTRHGAIPAAEAGVYDAWCS